MKNDLHLLLVAGCRPNFVKIAPLLSAVSQRSPRVRATLVHTGQHFDRSLSEVFFRDLGIRDPDYQLRVDGSTHATQTASLMGQLEATFQVEAPDLVMVVGDVNSTLAAALVAVKMGIPVAHVEAGLRSFDREMPEEINRVVTDSVSDYLFCTEPSAIENLAREGRHDACTFLVGNVMVDTLLSRRTRFEQSDVLGRLDLEPEAYCLLTLHRPSNVDHPERLASLLDMLAELEQEVPLVFPAHPRVVRRLEETGMAERLGALERTRVVDPLGYLDFLKLTSTARLVLTDSGGVQEETTVLGIPCVTLRASTERPITVEQGTNRLVGENPSEALAEARRILADDEPRTSRVPELWDGRAAERIVDILLERRNEIVTAYPNVRARTMTPRRAVAS